MWKGCCVIPVALFKICGEAHVWFWWRLCCDCGLVNYILCEALNRQRKIVWYKPPWNANVKTNLGRKFLNIIDRCFPNGHPLHKIFNKHTLKLSHSYMPNMKSIISSHNKALLSDYHQSQTQTNVKECNCRKKDQCPCTENASHKIYMEFPRGKGETKATKLQWRGNVQQYHFISPRLK